MKISLRKKRIKYYLALKNKSQNWLAGRLGISKSYLSQLLSSKRKPSPELRTFIMDFFPEASYQDLFEIEE
ncbi:MAG: helix-turn-helix transcriptional regulator [bacterium]